MFLNVIVINYLIIVYLLVVINNDIVRERNGLSNDFVGTKVLAFLFAFISWFTYVPFLFIKEYDFNYFMVLVFYVILVVILKLTKYFVGSFYEK